MAHKFYFGFAEVEYNYFTQRFEATLTCTTHDLELALSTEESSISDLEEMSDEEEQIVTAYINSTFRITSQSKTCSFSLVGYENKLDGTSNFYLESSEIPIDSSIEVQFNFLMKDFEEQQNKITLYYSGKTTTETFVRTKYTQIIQLENKEE
jgi:hypothetical protein